MPLAPTASSSAPIDAACPMQMVEIAGFTYCIVSYMAMPAATVNVGRKLIRSLNSREKMSNALTAGRLLHDHRNQCD